MYPLQVAVHCHLTNRVHSNVYSSMAHLQAVLETNAEVDGFSTGRKIGPDGSPLIEGDRMRWEWKFLDTGTTVYSIDIERIVPDEPELTELEELKYQVEEGASLIEAYEAVDLDKMVAEGDEKVAAQIKAVLALVESISIAANID